jgi:hypothetical protein
MKKFFRIGIDGGAKQHCSAENSGEKARTGALDIKDRVTRHQKAYEAIFALSHLSRLGQPATRI